VLLAMEEGLMVVADLVVVIAVVASGAIGLGVIFIVVSESPVCIVVDF